MELPKQSQLNPVREQMPLPVLSLRFTRAAAKGAYKLVRFSHTLSQDFSHSHPPFMHILIPSAFLSEWGIKKSLKVFPSSWEDAGGV